MSDFARVPTWIFGRVDIGSVAVFGAMASHANFETWEVTASVSRIAKTLDVSAATVKRHTKALRQAGAITPLQTTKGKVTRYRLNMKPEHSTKPRSRTTQVVDDPGHERTSTGVTNDPPPRSRTTQDLGHVRPTITERETRGESEGSPLSNLSGESEPITAEAIEKRLGLPGGGWKVIRQWFARDCTFDRWIEFQHAETNPEAFEALLADWSKRDPADRSRPAPNGLRVQLEAGPLRYYRDELRRQAHHDRQRRAEREADEAAKRRNGGGHLPAEARRALRAQLGFLDEAAEGEAETPRREHRPSEQGLTPVAI